MKIGTKGRYAVTAMIDLAKFALQDKPVPLTDIAERQELPHTYLEQLFIRLKRAGLVKSIRGTHGGYLLSRTAQDIFISHIVRAADEPLKLTKCGSQAGKGCMSKSLQCLSHHLWDGLEQHMAFYLERISLQDALEGNVYLSLPDYSGTKVAL